MRKISLPFSRGVSFDFAVQFAAAQFDIKIPKINKPKVEQPKTEQPHSIQLKPQ